MTHPRNRSASATPPATRPKTRLEPDDARGRARRAREEAMAVRPLRDGRYVVETDSTYVVDLDARSCTCPDHAIRGARCKHIRRVAIEINEGRLPAPDRRTAICAACGEPTFVPMDADGPHLCERHDLAPGDLVRDRETDSLLVVTARTGERADECRVEEAGRTVAAFETNADYGDHEPVIEAAYVPAGPLDSDLDLDGRKRYRFPATRLLPVERDFTVVDEPEPAGSPAEATA